MPVLDLKNLPNPAEVENIINAFDGDECAMHLHTWRNEIINEDIDATEEQNRAMILVARRIRALRENSKAKTKANAPAKKGFTLDEL